MVRAQQNRSTCCRSTAIQHRAVGFAVFKIFQYCLSQSGKALSMWTWIYTRLSIFTKWFLSHATRDASFKGGEVQTWCEQVMWHSEASLINMIFHPVHEDEGLRGIKVLESCNHVRFSCNHSEPSYQHRHAVATCAQRLKNEQSTEELSTCVM